jgi:RNA polymerase sigma factor (sigma-70 family)
MHLVFPTDLDYESAWKQGADLSDNSSHVPSLAERRSTLLDALSRKFRRPLIGFFFRRIRNGADAEELTQEVFYRLVSRPDILSITNHEGYVFEVAANLLRDRARKLRTRALDAHVQLEDLEIESIQPSQFATVEGKQRLNVLLQALSELTPRCRDVFMLNRFENFSHSQIAMHLGISTSAVEKHVMHAMAHLRARMSGAD